MRIPSDVTDQYMYFVAVDSTDLKTRETGLTSFTVYRSKDGAAASAMTTPTINETDSTNMPGVYELLLDEDMTIGSGNDSEEMCFHITQASMAPVTRTIELYRQKITAGNTLDVTATGAGGIDWGNIENKTTANDLSGTDIQLVDTTTTNTDMAGTNNAALASVCTEVRLAELAAANIPADIDAILVDTSTTIPADLSTILIDTGTTIPVAIAIVDANVDAILVDTSEIGAAGAGLSDLGGMSTGMKAEVNAECDTALTDYDGPTNAEMEARTPTAAQLAYIVSNAATGLPVTFTTAGGSTTAAVLNLVDSGAGSSVDDQYNGRLLVFTDGTLKGVVTDITDYTGSTTTATITAVPFAPTSSHNARLI